MKFFPPVRQHFHEFNSTRILAEWLDYQCRGLAGEDIKQRINSPHAFISVPKFG